MSLFGDKIFGEVVETGTGVSDGGGIESLLPTGAVMAYDFSDILCYTAYGITVLKNVITAPADSELQTAYDGFISDGANFQNALGKSNGYLLQGTTAEHPEITTKTTFTDSLHKAGAEGTINFQLRAYKNNDLSNILFSTSGGINNMGRKGIAVFRDSATNIQVQVMNGSGSTYALNESFTIPALTAHDDVSSSVAIDETAGTLTLWIGGTKYSKTGISYTSPTALTSGADPKFGYGGGSDGLETGARWYSCSLFNVALDDAGEQTMREAWQTIHERTY